MKCCKGLYRTLALTTATCLLCFTIAQAKKPDKPPGGGSGDDDPPPRYSVIEIPVDGDPVALSEPGPDGLVTVAIDAAEEGYVSAAFATVDATNGAVVTHGFLPEPLFVDANGEPDNGWSDPVDVNVFGDIVGYAGSFDPEATGDPNPAQAILWIDEGSGYDDVPLPEFPGATESRAFGTNNWGTIVGSITLDADVVASVAVLWDAETLTPVDLNTDDTADLGWELLAALDISDGGLIVGHGFLNGVFRGYLLDLNSGSIWPVPLIGPATENSAKTVNESGRVIGDAWEGGGDPWGSNPDYLQGYTWNGPGSDPVPLPSTLLINSIARGLNDHGAMVGNSIIPTDERFADRFVPTLWEWDGQGNVVATDLQAEIPSKPSYTLLRGHDVNNSGWISVYGRKRFRGGYRWRALLLLPASN